MRRSTEHFQRTAIFLILFIFLSGSVQSGAKAKKVDWSKPETINPLDPEIGDFLDIDLFPYVQRAYQAYRKGNFKEAARYFLFLLRHDHSNGVLIYNLACCYGRMGKAALAAKYLYRASHAGFTDFTRLSEEKDFDQVRKNRTFAQAEKRANAWSRNFGGTVYIKAEKLLKCRLHLPQGYDGQKSYPLLIGLHGNGGNAEAMASLWREFDDREMIYAAPQGAYPKLGSFPSKNNEYSWEIQIQDEGLWKRGDPLTVAYILEVARELSRICNIGEIYLLGHSQGAAYAYTAGIKHPDVFKGVICFGGLIPPMDKSYSLLSMEDVARGRGLRVFIAHGRYDRALNISEGKKARALLEEADYDVTFYPFEGGHEISPTALKSAIKWLLQNSS
jgi:phospholipase/carboxylesterase